MRKVRSPNSQGNRIKMSKPAEALFRSDCTGEARKGVKAHALIPATSGSIGKCQEGMGLYITPTAHQT